MPDNRWNHSDRDDYYPQDERPYRQPDYMGEQYYRQEHSGQNASTNAGQNRTNSQSASSPRMGNRPTSRQAGNRNFDRGHQQQDFTSDMISDGPVGNYRGRNHLSGSDYGGDDIRARGSYSRAIDADFNLGSTTSSYNAGPLYGAGTTDYRTPSTAGWQPTNARRESFAGRGPKGYQRSDERVREEVSEALFHHHDIDATEIEIEVKEGVVTLRGEVDERRTKRMAEEAIENLSGVRDVRNELTINKSFFAKAKEMIMGESDAAAETQTKPAQRGSKH